MCFLNEVGKIINLKKVYYFYVSLNLTFFEKKVESKKLSILLLLFSPTHGLFNIKKRLRFFIF